MRKEWAWISRRGHSPKDSLQARQVQSSPPLKPHSPEVAPLPTLGSEGTYPGIWVSRATRLPPCPSILLFYFFPSWKGRRVIILPRGSQSL